MQRQFLRFVCSFLAAILMLAGNGWAQSSVKVIYSFPAEWHNGLTPTANLLYVDGNLIGDSAQYGHDCFAYRCGVVFELTPSGAGGWTYQILYAFRNLHDAYGPVGNLVRDAEGNIYGVGEYGGSYNSGAVYKLSLGPEGVWKETIIYSFANTPDGADPVAGLSMDAAGNLYGTTPYGGTGCPPFYGGCGTVFKLTPNGDGTWSENVIHNFTEQGTGAGPNSEVIFDSAGNLYGTTADFGANSWGLVYELTPTSSGPWTMSSLYSFDQYGVPIGALSMDSAGNLLGAGEIGITNVQETYNLSPSAAGWSETTLAILPQGIKPYGALTPGNVGQYYGTTLFSTVGSHGGFLYDLVPRSDGQWTETVLHYFLGGASDGLHPISALTQGNGNVYYGVTALGGAYNHGTIYEFIP